MLFAQAMEESKLSHLTLRGGSDFFAEIFLPRLKNNILLDVSSCAFTCSSKGYILDYLATRRASSMAEVIFRGSHIGFPAVEKVTVAPRKVQDVEVETPKLLIAPLILKHFPSLLDCYKL